MDSLLEQLHDIEGIDAVSSWPLAIGWQLIMASGVLLSLGGVCYLIFKMIYWRSWKYDALKKLDALEKEMLNKSPRNTAALFSEYLRRIALKRFPRSQCASLTGEDWLKWLSENDPACFDWEKKGTILINAPYAPSPLTLSSVETKELMQAIKNWVR